jgi:hypothetical protein
MPRNHRDGRVGSVLAGGWVSGSGSAAGSEGQQPTRSRVLRMGGLLRAQVSPTGGENTANHAQPDVEMAVAGLERAAGRA